MQASTNSCTPDELARAASPPPPPTPPTPHTYTWRTRIHVHLDRQAHTHLDRQAQLRALVGRMHAGQVQVAGAAGGWRGRRVNPQEAMVGEDDVAALQHACMHAQAHAGQMQAARQRATTSHAPKWQGGMVCVWVATGNGPAPSMLHAPPSDQACAGCAMRMQA